jgi:hypothetical protein
MAAARLTPPRKFCSANLGKYLAVQPEARSRL